MYAPKLQLKKCIWCHSEGITKQTLILLTGSVHHWEIFQKYSEAAILSEEGESSAPISLSIHTEDEVFYGHNIPFSLEVSNKSEVQKNLYVCLTAEYVDEDGNGSIHFWQESFDVSFQAKRGNGTKMCMTLSLAKHGLFGTVLSYNLDICKYVLSK